MGEVNFLAQERTFPLLVLNEDAMSNNISVMADYCRAKGVDLAPHGKTTMAPEIFRRQIAAGAWGITAATTKHAQVCLDHGVQRLLIANLMVEAADLRWLVQTLARRPDVEVLTYVDSVESLQRLQSAAATADLDRPVRVLAEFGYQDGRTGCRTVEKAMAMIAAVHAASHVQLAGVSAFEGLLGGDDLDAEMSAVAAFLTDFKKFTDAAIAQRLSGDRPRFVISAGGSKYFDLVINTLGPEQFDEEVQVIIRSGCYVTHDAGFYDETSPFGRVRGTGGELRFREALQLWGSVLSLPQDDLAIVGFGRRDAPYDAGFPVIQQIWHTTDGSVVEAGDGFEIFRLDDQHAHVKRTPGAASLSVGDRVQVGLNHPCGAFDRWRSLTVVDDSGTVLGEIDTYF